MLFDGICLVTNNVPALADFYSNVLGIEALGDGDHVELKTEGANLAIFSVEGMEQMAPGSMVGAGHGSITVGFKVTDVDKEYERLKQSNIEFVKLPTTHPWGSRSFWFRDPDGNIINFFMIPGSSLR